MAGFGNKYINLKTRGIINKQILEREYINNRRSVKEIGKILKIHPQTLCYWMKIYNIPIRTRSEALKIHHNSPNYKGKHLTQNHKKKIKLNNAKYWQNKKRSKKTKIKISETKRGRSSGFLHRHHFDLNVNNNNKENIMILTNGNHQKFHRLAYHYLLEKFGVGEIYKYKKWFKKCILNKDSKKKRRKRKCKK